MIKKKEPVKEDDPKQSEAFRKAVSDLEAVGGLKDADGEAALASVLLKHKKPIDRAL